MKTKREKLSLNGWLNIDKPVGISSTQLTNKIKYLLNPKKIGHAGTLDPAASGILPLALGEATKTIEYMQDAKKAYQFTVKFGETTDSLDSEGKITETGRKLPALGELKKVLPQFIGKIKQTPPAFSAIKINGERAYDLARKGIVPDIKEREIEIYSLKLLDYNLVNQQVNNATFECECSKGTYIRTLGSDVAQAIDTIGYITFLRRIKVGSFILENAYTPKISDESLLFDANEIIRAIKPIDSVLDDIPVLNLDLSECVKLQHGLKIPVENKMNGIFRVYDENKKLIAISNNENGILAPKKVFNL